MARVKLNLSKLNQKLVLAFDRTAREFAIAQIYELEEEQWAWNGITIRKNGDVVFTPRDIVDTGNLRNSLTFNISANEAHYKYSVPYAAIVHEGGKTATGKVYPARPWVDSAIFNDPPAVNFGNFFRQ